MQTKPAGEIIEHEYGDSKNFMTPRVLKYGKISRTIAYEIAQGEGFEHETIYGISVAEWTGVKDHRGKYTIRRTDLSKLCYNQGEIDKYIRELQDKEER